MHASWQSIALTPRLDSSTELASITGNVHGHMRSVEGAAEIRDVSLYFAKVEALLTIRRILWHRAGVDIIKHDPSD